jgi:hypothetical protein
MSESASPSAPAPSGPPKLHRRTYVIDRGFQLKYTLLLVAVGALLSGLFGGMMYLAHVDAARGLSAAAQAELSRAETTQLALTVAMSVLMAAALGLFGVLITHRVAGPVYVMSHYVTVLAKGRYPLMRPLRKRDELKGFFDRFQEAIESLRSREADEADQLDHAVMILEPIAGSHELRAVIEELKMMRDRKKDATDRVEVGGQKQAA